MTSSNNLRTQSSQPNDKAIKVTKSPSNAPVKESKRNTSKTAVTKSQRTTSNASAIVDKRAPSLNEVKKMDSDDYPVAFSGNAGSADSKRSTITPKPMKSKPIKPKSNNALNKEENFLDSVAQALIKANFEIPDNQKEEFYLDLSNAIKYKDNEIQLDIAEDKSDKGDKKNETPIDLSGDKVDKKNDVSLDIVIDKDNKDDKKNEVIIDLAGDKGDKKSDVLLDIVRDKNNKDDKKRDKKKDAYKRIHLLCHSYIKNIEAAAEAGSRINWVKQNIEELKQVKYEDYRDNIQYTQHENAIPQGSIIHGTPEIEGRMICEELNIRLHIIDQENQITIHTLVDADQCKRVDENSPELLHVSARRFIRVTMNGKPNAFEQLTEIAIPPSHSGPYYQIFPKELQFLLDAEYNALEYIADPLITSSQRSANIAFFSSQFIKGSKWVGQKAFSVALFGLLTHDIACWFMRPEDAYGNRFLDILLGESTNELTWSSRLGSNNPAEAFYNIVTTAMVSLPVLVGILNGIIFRSRDSLHTLYSLNSVQYDIKRDLLIPQDTVTRALNVAEFQLLHSDNEERQIELIYAIEKIVRTHEGSARRHALTVLSNIARRGRQDIAEYALNRLQILAKRPQRIADYEVATELSPGGITNDYILWTKNRLGNIEPATTIASQEYRYTSNSSFLQAAFTSFMAYQLYAKAFFYRILVKKFKGNFDYNAAKAACDAAGRVYAFRTESQENECASCISPLVSYSASQTAQGCLDGILSRLQTPETILNQLEQLVGQAGTITVVNFSRQNWDAWSVDAWNRFLDIIEKIAPFSLKRMDLTHSFPIIFDMSDPVIPSENDPAVDKFNRLARFFRTYSVEEVILVNHKLGYWELNALLPSLHGNATRYLDLSGNTVGQDGMDKLVEALPNLHGLQTLKLKNNQLDNFHLRRLAEVLKERGMPLNLSIGQNDFDEDGIAAIVEMAANNLLMNLDISDMMLSVMSCELLGKCIFSLTELVARNCSLGSAHIAAIAPYFPTAKNLRLYDFSHNLISDYGVYDFFSNLANNTVSTVLLDHNQISNKGIIASAKYIAEKSIRNLDLSNNLFTEKGFLKLLEETMNTLMQLNVANIVLGDGAIKALAIAISTMTTTFQKLNLTNIGITPQSGEMLLRAIGSANSTVTEVILASNQLTGGVVARSMHSLTRLVSLDLTNCGISAPDVKAIVKFLSEPNLLKKLVLTNNTMNDTQAIALAQQLVTAIPHSQDIGNRYFPPDATRAITHDAKPNTNLTVVEVGQAGLTENSARAFCRVEPASGIKVLLDGNAINPAEVNIDTCQISSASPSAAPARIFRELSNVVQQLKQINPAVLLIPALPVLNTANMQRFFARAIQGTQEVAAITDGQSESLSYESTRPNNLSKTLLMLLGLTTVMLALYILSRAKSAKEQQSPAAKLISFSSGTTSMWSHESKANTQTVETSKTKNRI